MTQTPLVSVSKKRVCWYRWNRYHLRGQCGNVSVNAIAVWRGRSWEMPIGRSVCYTRTLGAAMGEIATQAQGIWRLKKQMEEKSQKTTQTS